MLRFRSIVILVVVIATMLFGALVAEAGWGWWWNAQIDVEGADVHTVWTVVDDPDGADSYTATIIVRVPEEAKAKLVSKAKNEKVVIKHSDDLSCRPDGIEMTVVYKIESIGDAGGSTVGVVVRADRHVLGGRIGEVGRKIKLHHLLIPGATCSGDNDDD